jgi:hypothetical protein
MYPTPYSNNMLRHPLFRREVRHVRWGFSEARIRGYSLRVFLIVYVVIFLTWLLLSLAFSTPPPYSSYQQSLSSWFVYGSSPQVFLLLIVAAIGVNLILDFASMLSGLSSINGEILAGRWDLLRLTALREEGIVNAKYAAAQVRAWRMLAVTVSIRVATIILGLFIFLFLPLIMLGDGSFFTGLSETLVLEPFAMLFAFVALVLTLAVYVVEPYWRMKALTALGLVISSYVLNTPLATLASVGAIFAVWLTQAVIAAILVFGLGFLLSPTIFLFSSSAAFGILCVFAAAAITAATIYGFYTLLQNWSLRRVIARVYRSN